MKRPETPPNWHDLVLNPAARAQLDGIADWIDPVFLRRLQCVLDFSR